MKEQKTIKTSKYKFILLLHLSLLIYSCCGFFSKNASAHPFMSLPFCLFYAGMIGVLGIYALLWQQVIKHLPVTFAYANKAVTVIWGVILGKVFFSEHITALQGAACLIIMAGTILYVLADHKEEHGRRERS